MRGLYANTFHVRYLYIRDSSIRRFWCHMGTSEASPLRILRDDCVCIRGYAWMQSHLTKGNVCTFSLAEKKLWPLCAVVDMPTAWWLLRVASNSWEGLLSQEGWVSSASFLHISCPLWGWWLPGRHVLWEHLLEQQKVGGGTSWILALAASFFFFPGSACWDIFSPSLTTLKSSSCPCCWGWFSLLICFLNYV